MKPIDVKLFGPTYDVSGISQCVREIALALYDNGVNVGIVDMPDFSPVKTDVGPEAAQKLNIMQRNKLFNPFVTIHFYPLDRFKGQLDKDAIANIFWSMYETDRIPYYWKLLLNKNEISEVWVPSEFNKESYIKSKVDKDKISVVNLGVNLDKYNPKNQHLPIKEPNSFYFSYISELKWCKGYEVLLKAFYEEFRTEPKAKLLFKCSSTNDQNHVKQLVQLIGSYKNGSQAEVILLPNPQTEEWMTRLYKTADCFVLPSRGEGWGLGIIQSMASGVPVITTDCSAQKTFANSKNSLMIDAALEKIGNIEWLMQVPVQNEHWWYEPNFPQLKKQMRYAFENKKKMTELGETARKDAEKFGWFNTAIQIVENLEKYSK